MTDKDNLIEMFNKSHILWRNDLGINFINQNSIVVETSDITITFIFDSMGKLYHIESECYRPHED